MAIKTKRKEYLGVHVTETVLEGIKKEAELQKSSTSHLVYHILLDWLEGCGYSETEEVGCCKKGKEVKACL